MDQLFDYVLKIDDSIPGSKYSYFLLIAHGNKIVMIQNNLDSTKFLIMLILFLF